MVFRGLAGSSMAYQCEATSVEGFVQQVAVSYVTHGYWFYVAGCIPPKKDPRAVDAKIIDRYGIDLSKWARARRKRFGFANLQYIRFERFFLILATHGQHRFYEEEAGIIRDVRRVPIRFAGHSISYRSGHASVRIEPLEYKMLRAYFQEIAIRRPAEQLVQELARLPFVPYAPIRGQLQAIVRAINKQRKQAGKPEINSSSLWRKRCIHRPFSVPDGDAAPR